MWANVPEGERVDQKGVSKSKILDDQNKIEALNGVINEMGTLIDVGMVGTLILEEIQNADKDDDDEESFRVIKEKRRNCD